jgi:hypothetical protein
MLALLKKLLMSVLLSIFREHVADRAQEYAHRDRLHGGIATRKEPRHKLAYVTDPCFHCQQTSISLSASEVYKRVVTGKSKYSQGTHSGLTSYFLRLILVADSGFLLGASILLSIGYLPFQPFSTLGVLGLELWIAYRLNHAKHHSLEDWIRGHGDEKRSEKALEWFVREVKREE